MDRGQLLRKIASEEAQRFVLAKVLDQLERCRNRNIPTATNFLTPQERSMTEQLLAQMGEKGSVIFEGGYENAERCIALFLPEYMEEIDYRQEDDYPLCAVRCQYRKEDKPSHRDFLGSLMGLGVRRDMLGDILVTPGNCDILLRKEIVPFVLQNYTGAGRIHFKVSKVELSELRLPLQERQEIRDTVAALRLDSIISSGFRLSRTKAAELIRAGKVEVNWRVCDKADHICAQGDVFSARGFGKCELTEVGGFSKKGRISVRIGRYR